MCHSMPKFQHNSKSDFQVVTCSHVRNFISPKWTDIFSPGLADVAHPLRLYCLATAERMQCQAIDLGNRVRGNHGREQSSAEASRAMKGRQWQKIGVD